MTGRKRKPINALELLAQLEKDEEYQLRKAKFDAELRERAELLRSAQVPIVADLREVGCDVSSVWDLGNTSVPYPSALPVLIEHLERGGYPDRVMDGLGRALAVKPSVVFWDRLKACYRSAQGRGEREGVAVALAACATPAQADDLMGLLADAGNGESRIHFIRRVLSVGGERGRRFVEGLRDDPVLGREATASLRGRSRRAAKRRVPRPLDRPVSESDTQNRFVQDRIRRLDLGGATDLRVNQHQVDVSNTRVGVNRPDVPYTII